jgi:hypothetical protein
MTALQHNTAIPNYRMYMQELSDDTEVPLHELHTGNAEELSVKFIRCLYGFIFYPRIKSLNHYYTQLSSNQKKCLSSVWWQTRLL